MTFALIMTTADYTDTGVRLLMVACLTYAITEYLIKPAVKARGGKWHRTQTRSAAVLLGAVFGAIPAVFPEWMPLVWCIASGAVGGSFAIAGHHAVRDVIPAVVRRFTGTSE